MVLASVAPYTPILIVLVGSGGLVGALVALVKLRGDTGSQAVSQAQGAAEVMEDALREVKDQRDYWRHRYEQCHAARAELAARLQVLERGD